MLGKRLLSHTTRTKSGPSMNNLFRRKPSLPPPDYTCGGRLANCRFQPYDIFIGRPSEWGNPYEIGKDGTRDEVIAKYEEYIRNSPQLLNKIASLRGKVLGCFCSPHRRCHGEILLKLIQEAE